MRSHWIRVGSKPTDWYPPKEGDLELHRAAGTQGNTPGEDKDRDWSYTATNQG